MTTKSIKAPGVSSVEHSNNSVTVFAIGRLETLSDEAFKLIDVLFTSGQVNIPITQSLIGMEIIEMLEAERRRRAER